MQNLKNKTKISTIALILTLTITTLVIGLPYVKAANVKTYAQLGVNPNPVGVNQPVTIIVWVAPIPPDVGDLFGGFTVTITKPDGTTTTLGPKQAWPHGAAFFSYTPTAVGDYTLKFNYPGETHGTDFFLPAESPTTTLTVQEERVPDWPGVPLPSDYWEGVVNTENRRWSAISGSWLTCYYNSTYTGFGDATSGYNPYSTAPRSPHIMWTKPATTGGLAGGDFGAFGEYSGLSYGVFLTPPIVMNGRLYYNTESSLWGHFQRGDYPGFVCVDLRTGEELWRVEGNGIDAGQHFMIAAPGGQGVRSFLWDRTGSVWDVYDPFDGKLLFRFENATSGTDWWWEDPIVYGEDGTMYVYILDGYANSLSKWNSTKAFQENGIITIASDGTLGFNPAPALGGSGALQEAYDWEAGIEWSVTIPDRNVGWHTPYSIFGISDGVAIAKSGTGGGLVDFDIAYDIETGEELWVHDMSEAVQTFFSTTGQGVFVSFDLATRKWTGFNIKTGAKLWDSDQNEYPWGTYVGYAPIIVYDKLLSGSWDGYLHAFDIETGKELWRFYSGDSGTEIVSGTWPFWYGPIVADGVAFVGTGEETPTQPLTRGNRVFAIDVETGEEIWSIAGYMSLRAIAEGYLLGYNGYDSQIYVFGKGPSMTTVTAPDIEVTLGESVMIKGMVTDQSEGAKGTPAISDEDMGAWMEYLYMQKPIPADAQGVQVKLYAIDPNGNYQDIGEATSDIWGNYGKSWEPPVEGDYLIIAEFEGSASYGSSSDSTYLTVGPPPSPAGPIEPEPTEPEPTEPTEAPLFTTTDLTIIAAVAVAVVIGIVSYWALRKRK